MVFIEGSNVYFAQKNAGKWLDWVKVKRFLEKKYQVREIRYYIGLRKNDVKMGKFLSKLNKVGFSVLTKPVKKIKDRVRGVEVEKANFDVEITADILINLGKFKTLILFSGDSDFAYLISVLRRQGKQTVVYSSKGTLSWELKLQIDEYFLLENLDELTKTKQFVKLKQFSEPRRKAGVFIKRGD